VVTPSDRRFGAHSRGIPWGHLPESPRRQDHLDWTLEPTRDEAVTWSDGALGCPRFGELYPQLPTQGFWIVFEIEGRQYDYRVDSRGRFRLCENPRGSGKLPANDR